MCNGIAILSEMMCRKIKVTQLLLEYPQIYIALVIHKITGTTHYKYECLSLSCLIGIYLDLSKWSFKNKYLILTGVGYSTALN